MTHSPPPGSYPAGRPADHRGNGTHSRDYKDIEGDEENALVTSPVHGRVGVFQAPQPLRGRTPATGGTAQPASRSGPPDHPDIDSPFLDLFSGARPRGSAPTRAPAPLPAGPTGRQAAAPPTGAVPVHREDRHPAVPVHREDRHPTVPHQHRGDAAHPTAPERTPVTRSRPPVTGRTPHPAPATEPA
ncbi:hypothetical protein GSF22_20735, partial [Micromonospora echinofusca]|nr:hypothetical protein [Micromonospora echinofusca]